MLITILDGYIDEPSRLGVPPFISPYPRYIAGAILNAGHEYEYLTIDHWRTGMKPKGELLFVISGPIVPGKYLRSMPMSDKELEQIASGFGGERIVWSLCEPTAYSGKRKIQGTAHVSGCDPDAFVFDYLSSGETSGRRRKMGEWGAWAIQGATSICQHQDFPQPLIAEIDMSYGCVHYMSGGCSFCTEPLFGKPVFRSPEQIIDEIKALLKAGCTNFRLGGQSCIFSYMAEGIGDTEHPKPNVKVLIDFMTEISRLEGIRVLHTDNANPAIIANHPEESSQILSALAKTCTAGNILSLGMESADPVVIGENNLNATPEEVMLAIKLINKAGAQRGPTGLPLLLPGLNFLVGLDGETRETFQRNISFLKSVLNRGYLLRRINIRQVASSRRAFSRSKYRKEFIRFKKFVREEIDALLLRKVVPAGAVLRDVFAELKIGKLTFARQIGTYPILVGIPQDIEIGRFLDVKVVAHGSRSITALEYPLDINHCQMSALEALPGIGKKRAARLVRARPFSAITGIENALDDPLLAKDIIDYLAFGSE